MVRRVATPPRPRVFVDADALFAGAAAPGEHGASLVVLRMAEITLIRAITSTRVIGEAERNLTDKLPAALPAFRLLVSRCLHIVDDATRTDLDTVSGMADPKDLPILAAAVRETCPWLVTFNVRHYQPGHPSIMVVPPGTFLLRVRDQLARRTSEE
jgi:hypothetical protein